MATNKPQEELKHKKKSYLPNIVYKNELPVPEDGCKFLPCGKTLMDYTEEPVSFPELEMKFKYEFNGFQSLFDLDLVNLDGYKQNPSAGMQAEDAALLADIQALHLEDTKPKQEQQSTAVAAAVVESAAVAAAAAAPDPAKAASEWLLREKEKQIIEHTFMGIKHKLASYGAMNGKGKAIAVQSILPYSERAGQQIAHLQFDAMPHATLLKHCGTQMISFNSKSDHLLNEYHKTHGKRWQCRAFISDERYKEEPIACNGESEDRLMLWEKDDIMYYQKVCQHSKFTKKQAHPQGNVNLLHVSRPQKK
ncbi:CG12674 [Drosophila busckii]|uniref:CG12674 n=1 Tax=Drosophila busckii TaxID=30019 RepID=A0A0M3QUA1_DROBS|nr:CG12674 [Drosophila busckii]